VVRYGDVSANGDLFGAHEYCTYENRIVPNFDNAIWFDVEGRPSVNLDSIADYEARLPFAAKAIERGASFQPAIASYQYVGR
jgi:hypothetical protein